MSEVSGQPTVCTRETGLMHRRVDLPQFLMPSP